MPAAAGSIIEPVATDTVAPGSHVVYRNDAAADGPTFIAIGSLHGNEAAGVGALQRVAERLSALDVPPRGRIVFLAGNTRALSGRVRYIDADLNRHWTAENIEKNCGSRSSGRLSEDLEQTELLALLDEVMATANDEVYALDLHSTSADGVPFATVGDTMRNREFAMKFPVTILLGIEEQLDGTLLEYINNLGAVTLGFEAGQHYAESTVDNHEALIWLGLVNSGVVDTRHVADLSVYKQRLDLATGTKRIVEVRYRHAIRPSEHFEMGPGFLNFDKISKGQVLARDKNGAVRSDEDGLVLMPLYQKQGEDGFFIGREVARFWIWLSGIIRRLKLAGLMPLLPGVSRTADSKTLEVNTTIARFFPLQIFHLLGFRKLRWHGGTLIVSRRAFDTESPFGKRRGRHR